ncbi:hypothetical protein JCM19047_2017 [Bacillus sp. JCM 19047]|nr:hypothetical protein JCM19047_2017 [Bacillus sp. JCM 19047]
MNYSNENKRDKPISCTWSRSRISCSLSVNTNIRWSIRSCQPWWTYLLILGIVFSGYQWIRALKEEKEIDEDFIEQEGNVYMERIQEAKKLKEQQEL